MNAHRIAHRCTRFRSSFVALLAAIGLLAGLEPASSAQVAPGSTVLATQFFDAIGGGSALYLVSPDAVLHTPEGDFAGRSGMTEFGDDLEASFSRLAFSNQSAVQAGDMVIVAFTITGVNTGGYHGLEANCARISVPAVANLRVAEVDPWFGDGQSQYTGALAETVVIEQWINYDHDVIASQISAFNQLDPNAHAGCAERGPGDA